MKNVLLITFLGFHFLANAQLKGFVFNDINNNGKKDANEAGVAGATVSDGYHVVKTDKKGFFKLPGWDKQRFVTLYPSAYFQCRKRFIAIEGETKTYNFAVTNQKRKENVRFVQISDTETFEQRDWVDNLKKYAKVHQPDFIVHTGDICYETGMNWHAQNLMSVHMGVPVYYCLGNHDLIKGEYGEEHFEKCFGPAWYAFEEGSALFVVTPMMGGDYKPGFTEEEIGAWLQNLLDAYPKNQPKVFFNHDLLTNESEFNFQINKKKHINLNDYNLKAWLFGHWHNNMAKDHGNGVVSYGTATAVMGGIDHSPSCFRVVDVSSKGEVSSFLKWTYQNRQMELVSPQKDKLVFNDEGKMHVSVNVYDSGAAVDSVKCAVWGEEGFNWKSSMQTEKWQNMKPQSDWNWSAHIDAFDQKHYELVVLAYLKSGEVLHQKMRFIATEKDLKPESETLWNNLAGNKEHVSVVDKNHEMPYQLLWTTNVRSNIYMSSPVVKGDYVMVGSFDDGNAENNHILCFNATTGQENWRYQTRNGVKNQMVVAGNVVIATDMQGWTYAINCETGKLSWEKNLMHNRMPGIVNGNVTDGKVVYAGFASSLCALDAKTGDIIWKNKDWKGGDGTTPTMTIAKDKLIASRQWGAIYAHDLKTGKVIWKRGDEGLRFRDGVLSYKDGILWVANRGNKDFGLGNLFQLNQETGETINKFPTKMQNTGTSAPVVLEDKVIVAGSHPGVAAFKKETGDRIWQFEVGESLLYTPSYFADRQQTIESTPVLVGDKVVFGAMDGCLYVLNADNGQLLWKTKVGAPIITSVAVTNNKIYVCDFAGNVYCYIAN
ncbi:MAG: PQQ-binding-like beta-propeller repeat protein [Carboxylicivirga sp.]|jgi:outer membrane protein assembly factor BamB|nr:PQQ-binding-like beta-propeller repeat protein [Carboxylicivirga sp.]